MFHKIAVKDQGMQSQGLEIVPTSIPGGGDGQWHLSVSGSGWWVRRLWSTTKKFACELSSVIRLKYAWMTTYPRVAYISGLWQDTLRLTKPCLIQYHVSNPTTSRYNVYRYRRVHCPDGQRRKEGFWADQEETWNTKTHHRTIQRSLDKRTGWREWCHPSIPFPMPVNASMKIQEACNLAVVF